MSRLKTDAIRNTSASADALTFDTNGNTTIEGNTTVDGTSTLTGNVTCSGNLTVSGTTTISGYHPTTSRSNRNLIINGAMQIAQRATSSTDVNYKTLDRWKHNHGGTDENLTYAQIDLDSNDTGPWAKGFRKAFKLTNGNQTSGAGADDYVQVMQAIEAQNIAQSGWDYTSSSSYITISFWIKSSVAQAFAGHLRTADGTSKSYSFSTGSLSANTWTKVTKTVPGASGLQFDNNSAAGLYFYIFGFMGTNLTSTFTTESWANASSTNYANDMTSTWWTTNDATLAITGVQLEVGDTATDYEHRSYGDELARCQRYYYRNSGNKIVIFSDFNNSTSNFWAAIYLPVTMRAAPTATVTTVPLGSVTGSGLSVDMLSFSATSGSTHFDNGTTIEASAEL